MGLKVMLAGKAPDDLTQLRYPVLASPKVDGVRAVVVDGVVLAGRSMRPIPNAFVQELFGLASLEGLDGELVVGAETGPDVFNRTQSGVMSRHGEPDVRFLVFDDLAHGGDFLRRHANAVRRASRAKTSVSYLDHVHVSDAGWLEAYEDDCLAKGYEGVMLRDPHGAYKQGRSTTKEGGLLKLKRFKDSEAVVTGVVELMHNGNEERTATGRRSTRKAGKTGTGVLGVLLGRDLKTGQPVEAGTGFTARQRADLWRIRETLPGLVFTYKFFPHGTDDRPRFPVFKGFRSPLDL